MQDFINNYKQKGFAVIRKLFKKHEVEELSIAADELKAEGMRHEKSYRHKNFLFLIQHDPQKGKVLRFCQWPSYSHRVFEKYRTDKRYLQLLKPLLGDNIKQIINQVIWKTPGIQSTSYGFHQDARFRRPVEAYRDISSSFIQTALAIDPNTAENGSLVVVEGSHLLGDLNYYTANSVYKETISDDVLDQLGVAHLPQTKVLLEPGDLVIWHPYLLHGSGPNLSRIDRRNYLNGFVRADACDLGEWVFKEGEPVYLGEPVLVQYMDLFTRPEPHYIDGSPHPVSNNKNSDSHEK
jgi:hypothetical protein